MKKESNNGDMLEMGFIAKLLIGFAIFLLLLISLLGFINNQVSVECIKQGNIFFEDSESRVTGCLTQESLDQFLEIVKEVNKGKV